MSDWKKDTSEAGAWEVTAGNFFADAEKSKGLRTTEDAKFYGATPAANSTRPRARSYAHTRSEHSPLHLVCAAISTKFPKFSNKDKTLIIQYVVKHEQNIDCGGGYMKLFPSTVDQKKLHGGADEDVYNMMFGPDICGSDKKTHVIFHYEGKNHLVNKKVKAESDTLSHLYKLVLTPDGKYTVAIDGTEVQSGELREDFDFLPPKMIKVSRRPLGIGRTRRSTRRGRVAHSPPKRQPSLNTPSPARHRTRRCPSRPTGWTRR